MLEVHPTTGIVHAGEDKKKESNKARVVVSRGDEEEGGGDIFRVCTSPASLDVVYPIPPPSFRPGVVGMRGSVVR